MLGPSWNDPPRSDRFGVRRNPRTSAKNFGRICQGNAEMRYSCRTSSSRSCKEGKTMPSQTTVDALGVEDMRAIQHSADVHTNLKCLSTDRAAFCRRAASPYH
eukprot:Skav214310  [mRNA]  locus=scaffold998:145985:151440:- [translate_table: standard]